MASTPLRLEKTAYKHVPGEFYGTPKEVWGFAARPSDEPPEKAAKRFLQANRDVFGLEEGLDTLTTRRVLESLGASHVILQQVHDGRRVHRGYVTVHLDREGRAYMVKNRAVPARLMPGRFESEIDRDEAIRLARRSLSRPERQSTSHAPEKLWFPRKDRLIPAWKIRLTREAPREEWIVYVNAKTGTILHKYDNCAEAPRKGKARVFDPSPVTALGDHAALLGKRRRPRRPPESTYRKVTLQGLDGSGTLSGDKVSTAPTLDRIRNRTLEFFLATTTPGTAPWTARSPSAPAPSTTPRTRRRSCTS